MKKNDLLLICSTALYSYLFYNQTAGINYGIMTIALIVVVLIKNWDKNFVTNTNWWLSIIGCMISSVCVSMYGNTLSIIATILSVGIMVVYSMERKSSLLLAFFYSVFSFFGSALFIIADWAKGRQKNGEQKNKSTSKYLLLITPIVITFIFLMLYRESNPLFKNFTSGFSVSFITFDWILFTIFSFLLMYGILYMRFIEPLHKIDMSAGNSLKASDYEDKRNTLLGIQIALPNELFSGIALFLMLNILLLIVNALDLHYLWIHNTLPDGINFSEAVHQGTDALIISILLALLIILIVFRGKINFIASNRSVRMLAYLWILQNVAMIISTAKRNYIYINEFSLTYKRIGVYVYLILCIIGLCTTLFKIHCKKSNWYLFRTNSWIFYGILVCSCLINWDQLITNYNLHYSKTLDRDYLLKLSNLNVFQLINSDKFNEQKSDITRFSLENLHSKIYSTIKTEENKNWQSYTYFDNDIYQKLIAKETAGQIHAFYIPNSNAENLYPIRHYNELNILDVSNSKFKKLEQLANFPKLTSLNLSSNTIDSLQKIPTLENLESLNLSYNPIQIFSDLSKTKNLRTLDISHTASSSLVSLPALPSLETLSIEGNSYNDLRLLSKYPTLKTLNLGGCNNVALKSMPFLENLNELAVHSTQLMCKNKDALRNIWNQRNLSTLRLSDNYIENLYFLTNDIVALNKQKGTLESVVDPVPVYLTTLIISNNKLVSTEGINRFQELRYLDISSNDIEAISTIEQCLKLETLIACNNKISEIHSLESLTGIKHLNLSSNKLFDVSPIKKLTQLNYLNLSSNEIHSIDSLKPLHNLTYLNLSQNTVLADISILKNFPLLEELSIANTNVKDISSLYSLKKLKVLYCNAISKDKLDLLRKNNPSIEIIDDSSVLVEEVAASYE